MISQLQLAYRNTRQHKGGTGWPFIGACPLSSITVLSQHRSGAALCNTAQHSHCESWLIGPMDGKILSSLSVEYKSENW